MREPEDGNGQRSRRHSGEHKIDREPQDSGLQRCLVGTLLFRDPLDASLFDCEYRAIDVCGQRAHRSILLIEHQKVCRAGNAKFNAMSRSSLRYTTLIGLCIILKCAVPGVNTHQYVEGVA